MNRKLVRLVLSVVLVLTVAVSVSAANKSVGMITDVGGLGDQSFNDAAYRGLQQAQKDFLVDITVIESNSMADYEPNLRNAADLGNDLIWGIGFLLTDAIAAVAPEYPDKKFGIIDAVVNAPNVMSVTYKEEEGSFLAGVLAALWTKTDKIGFIGGMEVPVIQKFEAGFRAGVNAVKPNAQIIIGYTGAFDDPGKGKELALTQYNNGVDIIFHASGACGLGVIEAAKERKLYAIGVDSDQSPLAPRNVVASMIKRVDVGVYRGVKALVEGAFKGEHVVLGLKEDGVGLAYTNGLEIPADIKAKVDSFAKKIVSGEIVVPDHPSKL